MTAVKPSDDEPIRRLRELLDDQLLAVLATQKGGAPYTSLVAFVRGDGMRRLVFATARSTRKYRNLSADSRASMLIDDRDNKPDDFADAAAATAVGRCREAEGEDRRHAARALVERHPQLELFVTSPSCAVMVMDVEFYSLVQRFQHVVEICPE